MTENRGAKRRDARSRRQKKTDRTKRGELLNLSLYPATYAFTGGQIILTESQFELEFQ